MLNQVLQYMYNVWKTTLQLISNTCMMVFTDNDKEVEVSTCKHNQCEILYTELRSQLLYHHFQISYMVLKQWIVHCNSELSQSYMNSFNMSLEVSEQLEDLEGPLSYDCKRHLFLHLISLLSYFWCRKKWKWYVFESEKHISSCLTMYVRQFCWPLCLCSVEIIREMHLATRNLLIKACAAT